MKYISCNCMPTKLNQVFEPYFSSPKRRDIFRRILCGNMSKQKEAITTIVDHSFNSVLDFGCGTGEFAEIFQNDSYHGVDIDVQGINYAKKFHPKYNFSIINNAKDIKESYD